MKRSLASVFLVTTLIVFVSCSWPPGAFAQSLFSQNKEQVAQVKADMVQAQATLQEQKDKALAQKSQAEAMGNANAVAELQKAIDFYDKAMAMNTKAMAVGDAITAEDGSIDAEKTITTVGGMLPFPFNIVALIGAPTLLGFYRTYKAKQAAVDAANASAAEAQANLEAAKSIVNSVDKMRIASPTMAAEMARLAHNTATDPRAMLTPKAAEIVKTERLT